MSLKNRFTQGKLNCKRFDMIPPLAGKTSGQPPNSYVICPPLLPHSSHLSLVIYYSRDILQGLFLLLETGMKINFPLIYYAPQKCIPITLQCKNLFAFIAKWNIRVTDIWKDGSVTNPSLNLELELH